MSVGVNDVHPKRKRCFVVTKGGKSCARRSTVHGKLMGIDSMDLGFYLIEGLVLSHHCKGWVGLVFFRL